MFTAERDRSGGGLVHAGKDLHQRGFSCTVITHKCHDFAGMHIEINIGQGGHGAEMLGNSAKTQDRLARSALRVIGIRDRGHVPIRPLILRPGRRKRPGPTSILRDAKLLATRGISARAELIGRLDLLIDNLRLQVLLSDDGRHEQLRWRIE